MAAPTGIRLNGTLVAGSGPHLSLTDDPLAGQRLATLGAADPDAGDSFTFELLDDAGGLFFLTGDLLRRDAGGVLDPAAATYTLRVRVTDSTGLSFETDLMVDVSALPTPVRDDGTAGNDSLVSGAGNQAFPSTPGNDTIDMGAGDVIVYSGRREDYALTFTPGESGYGGYGSGDASPDSITVVDLRPGGPDGEDLILNPTRLRFADGELTAGDVQDGRPALVITGEDLVFDAYVPENEAGGLVIGTLSALGLAPGEDITILGFDVLGFRNVSGAPVTQDTTALFTINTAGQIVTTAPLDFENHNLHVVRVDFQTTSGATFRDSIRLDVRDTPDAPFAAFLRQGPPGGPLLPVSVAEHANRTANVELGRLIFADIDGAPEGYAIALAPGFSDAYSIVGDRLFLRRGALIDAETDPAPTVDIIVRDLAARPDQAVTLSVGFDVTFAPLLGTAAADVIAGTAGFDSISGLGGDDRLLGGLGDDTLTGGAGANLLRGGEGDDVIEVGPVIPQGALRWTTQGASGTPIGAGFTQTIGAIEASVSVALFKDATASLAQGAIFLAPGEPFVPDSFYETSGSGVGPTSTLTVRFSSAGAEAEVTDVAFRLTDVDSGGWQDIVTVTALRADGTAAAVRLTPNGDDLISGNTVTASGGSGDFTDGDGSILVLIDGPVHEIVVAYANGLPGGQALGVSDIHFSPSPASAANRLFGEAGEDTLLGGAGNDVLDGGTGSDSMAGGAGNDRYRVDDALDVVTELAGGGTDLVMASADFVLGAEVENLTLVGPAGRAGTGNALANRILGGTGDDVLRGEGGNDVLTGGAGADTLFGGAGSDRFAYAAVADSSPSGPDLIADFVNAAGLDRDRVDLRGVDADAALAGDQAFAFIGSGPFTGTAGQLRVTTAGAGVFEAAGDVNGDGVADLLILIQSANAPTAGWFLL